MPASLEIVDLDPVAVRVLQKDRAHPIGPYIDGPGGPLHVRPGVALGLEVGEHRVEVIGGKGEVGVLFHMGISL